MRIDDISIADIEDALTSQGSFCLVHWLIDKNILSYTHYESWRYGEEAHLDNHLSLSSVEITSLTQTTRAHCENLGLSHQVQPFYSWKEDDNRELKASAQQSVHQALTQQWLRPQDIPQLDLFMDNSGVVAENDTINALSIRNFSQAQNCLKQLTEINPNHEKLGRYQDLINYGNHMTNAVIDSNDVETELAGLEQEVIPLASETLKHHARDYLAFAWRRLSKNLLDRTFTRELPKLHNSFVLMQVPDWSGALTALRAEKSVFEEPVLLRRLATCYASLKYDSESLFCWCKLAELDADFAEQAIDNDKPREIWPLWQSFWERDDYDSIEFFPAFVLASRPGIIHVADKFPEFTSPMSAAVYEGVTARLNKHDDMPARKKIRAISPDLLDLYLTVQ